jgi:hypothetical protein
MNRTRTILLCLATLLLGASGVLAWRLWPKRPPPPSTAEEMYATVMKVYPAELPEVQRNEWATQVAKTFDRLPPHEFENLLPKVMNDEAWNERFKSLGPEQHRKMRNAVSQEKQIQMMLQIVAMLKAMPAPLRKAVLAKSQERMKQGGNRQQIGKNEMVELIGSSTPSQRAQFVRSMREMRVMLEQAGVQD